MKDVEGDKKIEDKKEDKKEESKDSGAKAKKKKMNNEDLMKYEGKDDSFEGRVLKINKGEIPLNVCMDKAKRLEKIHLNKVAIDLATKNANKMIQDYKGLNFINTFNISDNDAVNFLNNNPKTDLSGSIKTFVSFWSNQKDLTIREKSLILLIKVLADQLNNLKGTVENLANAVTGKNKLDEQIQSKVLKGKENTQVKKIVQSSYIPDKEWNELSSIQKSLHQIKDWEQFPRYNIWTNYKIDEKKEFFKQRIKWNINRIRFLIDLIEGNPNDNKENWNTEINAGTCLINQLYYADKFARGGYCPEFRQLYKDVDNETRLEYSKIRVEARAIIEKLTKDKKIRAFVYRKNVRIQVDEKPYWEYDLDKIADEEIAKDGKNKRPPGRGRRFYKKNVPKGEENFS